MSEPHEENSVRFDIEIPDDLQAGAYANLLNVWHTPYEFTLDFAVIQQAQPREDGEQVVPARVVSRVRIPTGIMFEVLKALNRNLAKYEASMEELRKAQQAQEPRPPSRESDDEDEGEEVTPE